ncbi:hypothetical protein HY388_00440 [Candidatus Daviesbacteria bacterium]|nr:hypothetical protein [Candidatus Daviesbacteria bacterium]
MCQKGPPADEAGKIVLVSLIIFLLVLVGAVFILVFKGIIKNPLQNSSSNANLGSQIFEKTQNPVQDKIPETNPFTKVNPFKGVYKNPFQ